MQWRLKKSNDKTNECQSLLKGQLRLLVCIMHMYNTVQYSAPLLQVKSIYTVLAYNVCEVYEYAHKSMPFCESSECNTSISESQRIIFN